MLTIISLSIATALATLAFLIIRKAMFLTAYVYQDEQSHLYYVACNACKWRPYSPNAADEQHAFMLAREHNMRYHDKSTFYYRRNSNSNY